VRSGSNRGRILGPASAVAGCAIVAWFVVLVVMLVALRRTAHANAEDLGTPLSASVSNIADLPPAASTGQKVGEPNGAGNSHAVAAKGGFRRRMSSERAGEARTPKPRARAGRATTWMYQIVTAWVAHSTTIRHRRIYTRFRRCRVTSALHTGREYYRCSQPTCEMTWTSSASASRMSSSASGAI
jgi:hypothetical protein